MTNRISLVFVFIAVAGCSSDPAVVSAPQPGHPGEPTSSDIRVFIDISGDPSTGFTEYSLFVDGISVAKLTPGTATNIRLDYGQHTFALEPLSSIFPWPWWCTYRDAKSYTVVNDETHSPSVTFRLDCPPLDGVGTASLTFYEPRIAAKTDLSVTLTRLNGSAFSYFFTARGETENSVEVPPGLYRISASSAACNLPYVYQELDLARVVVRADAISRYSLTMDCR